ncbi:hypothetical protein DSBG_4493 [Desulfosporosinus sp. BG]|nr:hypothetical protein DSBG_4493 [Desulfosporosinus sp. BG]
MGIVKEEVIQIVSLLRVFRNSLGQAVRSGFALFWEQRLAKWTHNKAIQKAVESYRIGDEAKAYLRTLV